MVRTICFVVLALAAASPAGPEDIVRIQLQQGKHLVGRIVEDECTDEILVVRELAGNAKRRIPWTEIQDAQATELRVQLGFELADTAHGKMMVDGHLLKNKAGVLFRGLLLNPKTAARDGAYELKTSEGVLKIRVTDVVEGPTSIPIDLLAVYTADELYRERLKGKAPETAEEHFLMAEYCIAIFALDEAKKHYEACLERNDPKYTREKIQRALDRIERLLADRDAFNQTREIQRAIHYNNFVRADELIKAFRVRYEGNESLLKEAEALETNLKNERDDFYVQRVPRQLRETVKDLLGARVREEKEWTLRVAQEYAAGEAASEKSVTREALIQVGEKLGITPEETLEYWNRRAKRAPLTAFYRDGTFIVIGDLEDALSRAPKVPHNNKGPKPPAPRKVMTPEQWFQGKLKARKHGELRDWLYAWWAERSGLCETMDPKDVPCGTCSGKGYVQSIVNTSQGSVPFFDRCSTCHMAKFERVVRFR